MAQKIQMFKEETLFPSIIKFNIPILRFTNKLTNTSPKHIVAKVASFLTDSIKITFENVNACTTMTKAPGFKVIMTRFDFKDYCAMCVHF